MQPASMYGRGGMNHPNHHPKLSHIYTHPRQISAIKTSNQLNTATPATKIQLKINQIINSITYSRITSTPATHEQSMHPTGCLNYPYYLQSLSFYSNHSFYFLRSSHYSSRVLLQQTLFSKFPIPTISTSNVSSPWQQRPKIRPTASWNQANIFLHLAKIIIKPSTSSFQFSRPDQPCFPFLPEKHTV